MATPAGIKQEFPIYPKAPAHLRWSSRAIRGLGVYDHGQRTTAAMALGNWEVRGTVVCV